MQLFSARVRLLLMVIVWLIALGALVIWLGSTKVQRLAIGGGPAGSETLDLMNAVATVINEANIGLQVTVFETGGSYENLRLLESGKIELAEIQADTTASDSVLGLMSLYQDAYHLVVRDESEIDSFPALPGHRIAIPPGTSGQFKSFWFLAGHYGISPAMITALPMSEDAANFAMQQGQVDAVFRVRAPGNVSIRRMIGEQKLHLVPISQSEALSLKQPAINPGVIPLGSYRGAPPIPAQNLPTGVLDRLLVGRADLDQQLVYKFTRAVYERRADILEYSRLAGFIGPLPDDAESVIPAHPGARSYYDREKPGFMQQNARLVSALMYMIAIVCSALLALRTHWVRSRRMRMHVFNQSLMEIAASARSVEGVDALLECKHKLVDMLTEVIGDLERERVSQEEFEHFSFTWQAVDALVRDRLNLVPAFGEQSTEVGRAR
ncbi:MAG: TAXI family TRAP transporter solute-binding subunit [Halieaceae bacterium]